MLTLELFKEIGTQSLNELFQEHLTLSLMDSQGTIIEANDRYCDLSGYSHSELVGQKAHILNSRHHPPHFFSQLWNTILSGNVWQGDIKNIKKEGTYYWARTTIVPVLNDNGEIKHFLDFKIDITNLKLKEEKWLFEEEAFQEIISLTKTGGWSYFPESSELIWTQETYLLHEVPLNEPMNVEKAIGFYLPSARPIIQSLVSRAIQTGQGWDTELPIRTRTGKVLWTHVVGKVEMRNGEPYRIYGTFQNISERKEASNALKESEERLKLFLKHTPASVAMFDREMRYIAWSLRWLSDYQIEPHDLLGKAHYDLLPQIPISWKNQHLQVLSGETIINELDVFEQRNGTKDYIRYELHPWRDNSGEIAGLIMFSEIITDKYLAEIDKKNFEQKLQQTQKLESLGILAGGIAHDFNNLLTGILGNTQLAREKIGDTHELAPYLDRIDETSRRAADLCHQMLAYAGRGRLEKHPVDLNDLIQSITKLLYHSISKNATLNFELELGLPMISGDETQLRQIVMNLVINASDALGDQFGFIQIETSRKTVSIEDLDPDLLAQKLAPGEYIILRVSDNGCGMDEETQNRIFEPFYTTKFTGRGLGLSAVLGIVQGHNAALKLRSKIDEGTTFEIFLPIHHQKKLSAVTPEISPNWKGSGSILIVEDEPYVQEIVSRWVKSLGFDPLYAEDGEKGLEKFHAFKNKIQAVITDLTMPRLNGMKLLEQIFTQKPFIPSILMTGYCQEEIENFVSLHNNLVYLRKPLDSKTFKSTIERLFRACPDGVLPSEHSLVG